MPRFDRLQRLYVNADLAPGAAVPLDRAQANYLLNVLRMGEGDAILLFNGRDGEWRAEVTPTGRKAAVLVPQEQTREQSPAPDLELLFAPLRKERLDYVVQKAVEMGAGRLRPVITQHTQGRFNVDRAQANAVEAAEQCAILAIPTVDEPVKLFAALNAWEPGRTLVFCDENEESQNPLDALRGLERGAPLGVLIGPEGGFSEEERARLRGMEGVVPIPLGPRVLRADTAMVAALAVVQATLGDWR